MIPSHCSELISKDGSYESSITDSTFSKDRYTWHWERPGLGTAFQDVIQSIPLFSQISVPSANDQGRWEGYLSSTERLSLGISIETSDETIEQDIVRFNSAQIAMQTSPQWRQLNLYDHNLFSKIVAFKTSVTNSWKNLGIGYPDWIWMCFIDMANSWSGLATQYKPPQRLWLGID
jgi:hypothetical protein